LVGESYSDVVAEHEQYESSERATLQDMKKEIIYWYNRITEDMKSFQRPILLFAILIVTMFVAGCTSSPPQTVPLTTIQVTTTTASPGNALASMTEYPNITGVWISDDEAGYYLNTTIQPVALGKNTWIFTSQHGHVAEGYKVFKQPDGSFANQTLVGIFDPDGKSVYMIDQPGGWAKGTIVGPDTMFLVLTHTGGKDTGGNAFAMTMTFHRQKSQ
jgi:hypothetical protein